ncbi:hypothetical protein SporoP37_03490 [Sporosarcina sp. P37]|uniref:DUF3784 domain-containing protein n=1 Tax=unclassified Sporosarcina TaxID=2647733 RepID=UPI000A17EF30|nr:MULTISPECIES: DUF3784 domain-containing protein [unclassified Sporosarcina]ARK23853.1 hypothetical protein SporoP37_03490 [Sporosarcina sp. P37]PID17827.1 DUF3784 domain-containing protein [Sporosarcina sp. P35]
MLGLLLDVVVMTAFIVYGIALWNGKGASLLSGYNTMPIEKKLRINERALCKFMAKIMFALSFCVGLFAVSELLEDDKYFIAGLILFIGLIVFAIVYSNTGNRFKK